MNDDFTILQMSESEKSEFLSKILNQVSSAKIFDDNINFFEGVKLFQNNSSRPSSSKKIAVVLDPWIGRFGNNFIQFKNSLKFAKVLGINAVGIPENDFIVPQSLDDLSIFSSESGTSEFDFLLVSDFWPWPSKTYYQIFGHQHESSILPILRKSINLVGVDGISSQYLTVFIRSGDIFTESPNPNYGQPPFSFFRKVIEENPWKKVFIMAEDDSNPTSTELLDFCHQHGINHQLVRRGMRGDFEFLLGSTNLCFGFTSLIPALAQLSKNLLKAFSFETRIWTEGVQIVQIKDEIGIYKDSILNNNWKNSSDQLKLMLSYPLENLEYITVNEERDPKTPPREATKSVLLSPNGFSTAAELINYFSKTISAENYLEIGVLSGLTFSKIEIKNKTAVDRKFSCDPKTLGGSYSEKTSNEYFETLDKNVKFDMIYLDGDHTFEQTLVDLMNSMEFLSDKGLIILDDVYPSDYLSSLSDHHLALKLKAETNETNRNWMGDVYKTVAFAKKFMPHFNYATAEGALKQTIFWRNSQSRNESVGPGDIQRITNLQFADIRKDSGFFNFQSGKNIEAQIRSDLFLDV